jgi:cytochrome c biogenesis protein CcdA
MFVKLFQWASDTGNPLYGAATFALQSLGNVLLVSLLFAVLILGTRGRFLRWFAANPRRMSLVSGTLLLALGVFTVVYWDLRVPSIFGIGWFPEMPYN